MSAELVPGPDARAVAEPVPDPELIRRRDDSPLARAMDVVSRHSRIIVGTPAVLLVMVLAVTLSRPRTYTASASFMPQTKRASSSLSGLAAQFGVTVPLGDAGDAPDYYIDLLRSRDILRAAVETRYPMRSDTGMISGTLVDLYHTGGTSQAAKVDNAIATLKSDLTAVVSPKTGIVRVAVKQRRAGLASMVVTRLLALLSQFNVETRQSQAAAERQFTERRLDEVRGDLRAAENRLQGFMQGNRDYRNAPALLFDQQRLQSEVTREQQIYATLSQAYEQAKIEEVRDTPVFTIIEKPETPPGPDSRGILFKSVLAIMLGLTLGLLLALARDAATRARRERLGEPKIVV
ncbi:MAG: hypothetical protein ACR2M1_16570 [Gemmatimonadaceae bacterium]